MFLHHVLTILFKHSHRSDWFRRHTIGELDTLVFLSAPIGLPHSDASLASVFVLFLVPHDSGHLRKIWLNVIVPTHVVLFACCSFQFQEKSTRIRAWRMRPKSINIVLSVHTHFLQMIFVQEIGEGSITLRLQACFADLCRCKTKLEWFFFLFSFYSFAIYVTLWTFSVYPSGIFFFF